jgi:hypothetical protein
MTEPKWRPLEPGEVVLASDEYLPFCGREYIPVDPGTIG